MALMHRSDTPLDGVQSNGLLCSDRLGRWHQSSSRGSKGRCRLRSPAILLVPCVRQDLSGAEGRFQSPGDPPPDTSSSFLHAPSTRTTSQCRHSPDTSLAWTSSAARCPWRLDPSDKLLAGTARISHRSSCNLSCGIPGKIHARTGSARVSPTLANTRGTRSPPLPARPSLPSAPRHRGSLC